MDMPIHIYIYMYIFTEVFVPLQMFYGHTINYHDVLRLGGLASHLRREHRQLLHARELTDVEVDPSLPKHKGWKCSKVYFHKIKISVIHFLSGHFGNCVASLQQM